MLETIVHLVLVPFVKGNKMIVENVVENEDGSADIDLHLNKEEVTLLIQEGFITLIKKYVEDQEVQKRVPALLKMSQAKVKPKKNDV